MLNSFTYFPIKYQNPLNPAMPFTNLTVVSNKIYKVKWYTVFLRCFETAVVSSMDLCVWMEECKHL